MRGGIKNVLVHNVANQLARLSKKQLFEGNNALKHTLLVGNVSYVDGFFVKTDTANTGNGFFTGHVFAKINKFAGHNASRAFFGVSQEAVDLLACFGSRIFHDALNNACGHFFQHINGVIGVKLFQHFTNFAVGHVYDDQLLQIGVQFCKHLGGYVLFKKAENARDLIFGELREQISGVYGVAFVYFLYEFSIFFLQEQFLQRFKIQNIGLGHKNTSFFKGERDKRGS